MRIALTGASGFIGRYIARHLISQGHSLRCWRRATSDVSGFEPLADSLAWVEGDLADPASVSPLVAGCDAVVHSALYHPGAGFMGGEGDLLAFAETNILGTLRLIEGARAANVGRFVFISTCAVHDRIFTDRALDEKHPCQPASHYGAHKAALEQFVYSYGLGEGYPICALRPTGVYGAAHRIEQSKWYSLVEQIVRGETVECRKGGKEVHAADVAQAVGLLLSAEAIAGEVFNCCDRYVSQYDVAMIAKRLADSPSQIAGGPTQPKHEIETAKLRGLGMKFGGQDLLEATVAELVAATRG